MKGIGGFNDFTIYVEIHENILMHKIILFEYLERFLSIIAPLLCLLITLATIITTIMTMIDRIIIKNCQYDRIYLDWIYLILAMTGFIIVIIYL